MTTNVLDDARARGEIRRVIDEWVFFRDDGDWPALRALFSSDGRMTTNSLSASADAFISYCRDLRAKNLLSHHFMGPSRIRVNGAKALAETQATLMARSVVHGVEVDLFCLLRYLDRFVHENGAWRIQDRHPIYIKDRIDPVVPGAQVAFDRKILDQCPAGCRYLVYLVRVNGAPQDPVQRATYGDSYAAELYAAGEEWLKS